MPLGDPRRPEARTQWREALGRDDTSRVRGPAAPRGGRAQVSIPLPRSGPDKPLSALGRLLAFGALAWALGFILAFLDQAGGFSLSFGVDLFLLLGFFAFLAGLALVVLRMRPPTKQVLVETEIRDVLTGLPNERYLLLRLEEEIARAHRHERALTLAVLDVNGLAAINDQYGRECGDQVLRHVATIVDETKRASDILARLGDDEFAVVLPECSSEGGQAFLRRLSDRLAREPAGTVLNNRPSHVWVGVCTGLVDLQSEQETAPGLVERARADLNTAREERDRRRQLWRTA
jgi:diguanylate cyclase (GGDEF)-like protein